MTAPLPHSAPASSQIKGRIDGPVPPHGSVTITYPWPDSRLSPNGRINRQLRARLTKQVRTKASELTFARGLNPMTPALPVEFIYHPPSARWDDDNVRNMGKATRDGIADAMGVDDRTFSPTQTIGVPVKGGAIMVRFDPIPD